MPPILTDPPPALWLLLGVAALAAFGVWLRWRGKKALIAFVATLIALVVLFILDKAFESPRETVLQVAAEMQADFNSGDWNRFGKHVADNFDRKGKTKADLKAAYELSKGYNAKVAFWGFNRDDVRAEGNAIVVGFDAKPEGAEAAPFHRYVRGRFERQPDGSWRLASYTTYKVLNHEVEEELPLGW